jgi:hypothetical protein
MTRLARLRSWIRARVGRADLDRRMQIEMQTHMDLYEADLRRRGLSDEESHRRARAEFGSVEARKDECRDALGLRLVAYLTERSPHLLYDLHLAVVAYSMRSLLDGREANRRSISVTGSIDDYRPTTRRFAGACRVRAGVTA